MAKRTRTQTKKTTCSAREAAAILDVATPTVRVFIRSGLLRASKPKGSHRESQYQIDLRDVRKLKRARRGITG